LIEIKRGVYQHWALYVGDGYVIHLTGTTGASWQGGDWLLGCPRSLAKVKKQLLKEVVGNNKWSVNNKYDRSRTPLPVEEIIRRAEHWIDREVTYDVVGSNCEHFVTMLRYEKGISNQVSDR
ncbi:HRSL1 enzyme, partial [Vireo altiloquus]|nr:HRSL1 enzyme [Vireo altiloquus]